MFKLFIGLVAIVTTSAAYGATDFGIRVVSRSSNAHIAAAVTPQGSFSLASAALVGSKFGRVTSLRRSPEHNRRVGGVSNSYHLSGRAMDVARAPGVSHSNIRNALLAAGYTLVESLDEGDHSHFAFTQNRSIGLAANRRPVEVAVAATQWRMITAPLR